MSLLIERDTGPSAGCTAIRHDWTRDEVRALFALPFPELLFRAQSMHRAHFDPTEVQLSTLLSIKTGGCPEDCAYCPQSAHYETGVEPSKLMALDTVLAEAARGEGRPAPPASAWAPPGASPRTATSTRCSPWSRASRRSGSRPAPPSACSTADQAHALKAAGLDDYNHNLDTSPEYYGDIITTRTYQERLDTLAHVRDAGITVCCGGIVGMGESAEDRVGMLVALATLPAHPESVPINVLVRVEGTPLASGQRRRASSIRWSSCARSRSRASPCRRRWCGSRPAART